MEGGDRNRWCFVSPLFFPFDGVGIDKRMVMKKPRRYRKKNGRFSSVKRMALGWMGQEKPAKQDGREGLDGEGLRWFAAPWLEGISDRVLYVAVLEAAVGVWNLSCVSEEDREVGMKEVVAGLGEDFGGEVRRLLDRKMERFGEGGRLLKGVEVVSLEDSFHPDSIRFVLEHSS